MWPNEWPLTISRSLWPIFHGSVILPYILNTICWINVTPGILVPCDPIIDVKISLLLVWPIFHGSVILSYILNTICWINVTPGIFLPCDPMNDHLLYLGHCDLYFMLQWFCLYFYYYFMENCHTWIIISMWQNDLHTNTSRSLWPILYGLMIKMLQYKMYPAGELRCPTKALVLSLSQICW